MARLCGVAALIGLMILVSWGAESYGKRLDSDSTLSYQVLDMPNVGSCQPVPFGHVLRLSACGPQGPFFCMRWLHAFELFIVWKLIFNRNPPGFSPEPIALSQQHGPLLLRILGTHLSLRPLKCIIFATPSCQRSLRSQLISSIQGHRKRTVDLYNHWIVIYTSTSARLYGFGHVGLLLADCLSVLHSSCNLNMCERH